MAEWEPVVEARTRSPVQLIGRQVGPQVIASVVRKPQLARQWMDTIADVGWIGEVECRAGEPGCPSSSVERGGQAPNFFGGELPARGIGLSCGAPIRTAPAPPCRICPEPVSVNRRIPSRGVSRPTPMRLSILGRPNPSAWVSARRTRRREALPLDPYRQLVCPGEHRCRLAKPVFVQLFQDRVNQRILPSAKSFVPMVLSQLHGIPEWPYPARALRSRGSSTPTQANVQTSGYSTKKSRGSSRK